MPKIPTFTAKGSIEQLAGTTSNIQMGLNNTLAGALAPITEAVVDFKIKENDVQNRTEALKLKNDYLSETSDIEDQINQDKILSVNKEAANKFLKEKNNALIEKYSALATTQTAKTMFTNSALSDVSKQIFSIDSQISRNILVEADRMFVDSKEKLFSKAYLKGGIYKQTLQTDTEKLIIDSYKSRITAPELQTMLASVPSEIQMFDGIEMVQKTPRAAFYFLKDEKNLPDITYEQRTKLTERASVVIREQLTTEWKNNLAMKDVGKEPPEFNMKLAQEVFGAEVAQKMLQEESVRKDSVVNTSLLMTSPQKDVNELLKNIIDDTYERYEEIPAREIEKYYIGIANTRNENLIKDPVQFIRSTNDYINSLFEEIQNDTNAESRSKSQIILGQELIKEQKRLGVPLENQKVMSDSMALGFIKEYNDLGFEGKSKERQLKLQSLEFQYGDLSSNALEQLIKAGLPTGAESALVLGDAKTFDIFMSFDDPEKVKAITNYLTDQDDPDISLKKIRAAIVSESDFKDIDNIISRNTPFNNSKTLVKMDQIKETLSLYAANLMRNNPGMSVNNAAKEASLLFSDNYQIEDTYYFPKNIQGINQKQRDFTISKLENIKFNYVKQHFKPVAYESSVEGKTDLELTERMNYNIIENGEWRNHPNGEGFVFGIVLTGNSFGILKNEAGEELFVSYDDDSLILPGGSNTIIDMSIPTEQQKKQFRGYYGYADKMKQENTTFGQRTNLDNNEMQNALEDSGASTVEISNVFSTAAEASEIDLSQKYNKLPNLEPVKQEWLLTTAKKVFDINKDEIIPSDIILAINSGETGYGTSRFFKEGSNNLFNIQTFNKNTPHIKAKDSDQMIKKYNTVEDSIIDFLSMVKTSKKYKKVREQIKLFNEGKGSKDKIIDAIAATGFAEDEKWSSKTKSILKKRINGKHKNELSNLK
jgi:flagellum-specific peptidoglycan hydrolase FlgJ